MTHPVHDVAVIGPRVRPGISPAVAAIGALDVALVAVLLFLDKAQVASQHGLARVGLGVPLPWVTQNQVIDPPLPWRTGVLSPWENPTTVAWLPLVMNLVIVGLLLTGLWIGLRTVRASR